MPKVLQFIPREMPHSQGWASCQHCRYKWQAVAAKGTQAGLTELTKGRALGDISRRAWIDQLKWRNEISPDFDADLNDEELSAEGPALSTMGGTSNVSGTSQE